MPRIRELLLAAGAAALEGAGAAVAGEIHIIVACDGAKVRFNGPPGAGAAPVFALPSAWQRVLDVLAARGDWTPAAAIHRVLNPKSDSDRAFPDLRARLADMEEAGLIECGHAGYRAVGQLPVTP